MKKILEALVDMYGMATYITDDESIKAVYMGIQRSGKFTWDSEKQKQLPAAAQATEVCAFFLKKCKMWDVNNKSLQRDVGIAAQAKKIATQEQQIKDLQVDDVLVWHM